MPKIPNNAYHRKHVPLQYSIRTADVNHCLQREFILLQSIRIDASKAVFGKHRFNYSTYLVPHIYWL